MIAMQSNTFCIDDISTFLEQLIVFQINVLIVDHLFTGHVDCSVEGGSDRSMWTQTACGLKQHVKDMAYSSGHTLYFIINY